MTFVFHRRDPVLSLVGSVEVGLKACNLSQARRASTSSKYGFILHVVS